ncbi:MAG: carbohydrate ABC transporter permease, partial [Pseudomonadota bacterium]
MDNIAGSKSSLGWVVNISVVLLVALWVFPTFGLLVSSFRTADQISGSGWWASLFPSEQTERYRVADPDDNRVERGDLFVVEGSLFEGGSAIGDIQNWGTSSRAVDAYQPGDVADLGEGETFTLDAEGNYVWSGNDEQISGRGQRAFVTAVAPPEFTTNNYVNIMTSG